MRLLLRLGVLSLLRLVFRFLRVRLLLFAGQRTVGAAARTGCAGAFRFAVSGVTGRLSCLQDGDLLRRGLQDGIVRLGRPHAHERQTDTQQQRTDQYAAAGLLHPWVPFKKFFHVCSPSGKRASPLKKSAFCAAYSYF